MNVVITILLLVAMSVFIVYSVFDIVKKVKGFKKSKNNGVSDEQENESTEEQE